MPTTTNKSKWKCDHFCSAGLSAELKFDEECLYDVEFNDLLEDELTKLPHIRHSIYKHTMTELLIICYVHL